ncbi:MAG: hypothetical protein GY764_02180 [Halieaceae bacterium]|nr:hypothetical protein [Halieaceae bacterium]
MTTSCLHSVEVTAPSAPGCNGDSSLKTHIRGFLYHILAELLADPAIMAGEPLASRLAEAVIEGAETLESLACRQALFALGNLPKTGGEDLCQRFEEIINRPNARPIPLYESLALSGHLISPENSGKVRLATNTEMRL